MPQTRVLIADDYPPMRYELRRVLEPEFEIVGQAENGVEAVRLAEECRPDVVLLDLSMPVMGGVEATKLLRTRLPDTRVILVSSYDNPSYIEAAFAAGGHGYVVKGATFADLGNAIRTVMEGGLVQPAM